MKFLGGLLLFAVCISCNLTAQQPDNTKPMYGEIAKSAEVKAIDDDFKKECIAKYKTLDSAAIAHVDFAWRYFYNNELGTAMKRFNQAWLLNNELPDPYFGFAALMDLKRDETASARFYKLGHEKDAHENRAKICYQRIADCKEQLQDFKGTIAAYKKLSVIEPNNSLAFKKLGYLEMLSNNIDDAFSHYAKAMELDPADAVTYNNRGILFQKLKNYKSATGDYSKAITLDPKYIGAYVNRGITEMEAGNFKLAKRDFESSVALDSQSGELRRLLAIAKLSLRDKADACKDLFLAKQLGDLIAEQLIHQNCE